VIGTGIRRKTGKAAAAGLLAFALLVMLAGPVWAHSVLLATSPARSSTISGAPASVVLTFNEMPRGEFSDIHIVGPDGARRDSGHVKVLNDTVTEDMGGTRPAGTYVVDWRVISADGHPVSGQFSFTATSAAPTLGARQTDTTGSASGSKGSGTVVIVLVVVVLVLLAGALTFVLLRRRRPAVARAGSDQDDDD
jgi:methionine-rich copper-binding protein CopC